jgi:hypothetical protein
VFTARASSGVGPIPPVVPELPVEASSARSIGARIALGIGKSVVAKGLEDTPLVEKSLLVLLAAGALVSFGGASDDWIGVVEDSLVAPLSMFAGMLARGLVMLPVEVLSGAVAGASVVVPVVSVGIVGAASESTRKAGGVGYAGITGPDCIAG